MAAKLSLLSLTQLQKLAQSQQNQTQQNLVAHGSWVWNPKGQQPQEADDDDNDDSWEVRAFAEDTTWPPRSYTCTFCTREFRSAQALGGHMNVHRRDRARLHQTPSSNTPSPTREFATNGGLCLLYQLPNPNGVFNSPPPYPFNNMMPPPGLNKYSPSSHYYSITKPEPSRNMTFAADNNFENESNNIGNICKEASTEELDLELRLGHIPTTS